MLNDMLLVPGAIYKYKSDLSVDSDLVEYIGIVTPVYGHSEPKTRFKFRKLNTTKEVMRGPWDDKRPVAVCNEADYVYVEAKYDELVKFIGK
jgi:hypothetical protein